MQADQKDHARRATLGLASDGLDGGSAALVSGYPARAILAKA